MGFHCSSTAALWSDTEYFSTIILELLEHLLSPDVCHFIVCMFGLLSIRTLTVVGADLCSNSEGSNGQDGEAVSFV